MIRSVLAYQGRAGDRNDLATAGARRVAAALARRLGVPTETVGTPAPALAADWQTELEAASADFRRLGRHLADRLRDGAATVTALNRCAAAIATLPAVLSQRPGACVVWLDAHADLNTPASTSTGYLGGMAISGPAGLWESGFGGPLPLSDLVLVGARDIDTFEAELIRTRGIALVAADDADVAGAVRRAVAGRPVYLHVDCDVMEPGLVPTEYQVARGLGVETLRAVCEALAGTTIVGVEIAEFQDTWQAGGPPASPDALLDAMAPLWEALARE